MIDAAPSQISQTSCLWPWREAGARTFLLLPSRPSPNDPSATWMELHRPVHEWSTQPEAAEEARRNITRARWTAYLTIVSSLSECAPERCDDPQHRCNREQQEHDGPTDDAGQIQPRLLRLTIGLSRGPTQ